ncbi:MAG: DUF1704 domain-containing protein [Planctomycetota bacterium]|nr:DUF1704 domain-containing protein [Planctomycetota bacterium]MDA1139020.1 DUF1704 domain-containing protein [Planctomycetota bacterium]
MRAKKRVTKEEFNDIAKRLAANQPIRRNLSDWGRVHIDRKLPFLCVYRRPPGGDDSGTERLVTGEPAYLIGRGERPAHLELTKMVKTVVETLSKEFGTFLIVEIWTSPEPKEVTPPSAGPQKPFFRILHRKREGPESTIEVLKGELGRIRINRRTAEAEVTPTIKTSPPGLQPLLLSKVARSLNCQFIGIELRPIYRDAESGAVFPIVRRSLRRGMTLALRRAFFEFAKRETSHQPPHYHAMGRKAMVRAAWNVDAELAAINRAFDFLLLVSPTNSDQAWSRFQRSKLSAAPLFLYRPVPFDPSLLKRKLYHIPIERVEDPTLGYLFGQKRRELEQQLSMLQDRGTKNFLLGSLQLHGGVDDNLYQLARDLLEKLSSRTREDSRGGHVNAEAFAERARQEIDEYRKGFAGFTGSVQIRSDLSGLMVSQGHLLIGKQIRIPISRVDPLIQHEIGTHMLTYYNGRSQPLHQLYCGLSGYDELQEGLAVFSEYLVGGLSRPRLRLLAARVVAARQLIDGASFVDIFRELDRTWDFEGRTAFTITMRVWRGGGLTKDATYLRGLMRLIEYLQRGGKLAPLFVGKIAAEHISIVEELQWRKILLWPPLIPNYLERPETAERLARITNGLSIIDLTRRD